MKKIIEIIKNTVIIILSLNFIYNYFKITKNKKYFFVDI
jgi:hypothetical protein